MFQVTTMARQSQVPTCLHVAATLWFPALIRAARGSGNGTGATWRRWRPSTITRTTTRTRRQRRTIGTFPPTVSGHFLNKIFFKPCSNYFLDPIWSPWQVDSCCGIFPTEISKVLYFQYTNGSVRSLFVWNPSCSYLVNLISKSTLIQHQYWLAGFIFNWLFLRRMRSKTVHNSSGLLLPELFLSRVLSN